MRFDVILERGNMTWSLCILAICLLWISFVTPTLADSLSQDEAKRLNSVAATYLHGDSGTMSIVPDYVLSTVEEPNLILAFSNILSVDKIISIGLPEISIMEGKASFIQSGESSPLDCDNQPLLFVDDESGRLVRFVSHEFLLKNDSAENRWAHLPVLIEENIIYSIKLSSAKPIVGAMELVGTLFGERPLLGGQIGCPVFEAFYLENEIKDEFRDRSWKSIPGDGVPYWYFVIYRHEGSVTYTEHVKISREGEEIDRAWIGLEPIMNPKTHFKKPIDSLPGDSSVGDSTIPR